VGFTVNRTAEVVDAWLAASATKRTWATKVASQTFNKVAAVRPAQLPEQTDGAGLVAAHLVLENGSVKLGTRRQFFPKKGCS
jgi:hypothetical protein